MARKRNKTRTKQQEPTRPELFSAAIYKVLQNHILSSENYNQILLCMCDYKGCDISSQHSRNEPYSHVIVVCIKFLKGGLFQPIGSLIYQRDRLDESISAIIKMLRMYVETLNELGYEILGSVSSCDIIFERIFGYLVNISSQSAKDDASPMIYEIGSTRLVHVFDIFCLYSKFTTKWTEHDIYSYNGSEFGTSSWFYIYSSHFCLLYKDVLERFHLADIPINLKLLKILSERIATGKTNRDGMNTVVILENITHLIMLCSSLVLINIKLQKLRVVFMNYVRWLQNVCFMKEKAMSANISTQPPDNFFYFCTITELYTYYNVYSNLEANSISENISDETIAYVCSLIDKELVPLHQRNFFPKGHLTHIKSEINKDTTEDVPFVNQMIQTILGILEIVPSLPKENFTVNIFNVQPVASFMHHVVNEKNKIKTSPCLGAPSIIIDTESAYEILADTTEL